MKNKVPKPGDAYYCDFEEDYLKGKPLYKSKPLTISSVDGIAKDSLGRKGYSITASDGIGYDCFWSKILKAWVYALKERP